MVLSLWKQLADVVKTKDLHGLAAKHGFYGDKTQPNGNLMWTYSLCENPIQESHVIIENTFAYGCEAYLVAVWSA